jgi:hypothetical protein
MAEKAQPAAGRNDSLEWQPQPGPQSAMLECPVEDLVFGGARGGGKTVGLLLDFVRHATKYGGRVHGAIFRKRFTPDLQDVIRKGQILLVEQLKWKYHGTEHRFTAPNGATLHCYYVENLQDALNYKGHEWEWLGIDEAGDWPDSRPIDFLWGCLRSPAGIPCVRRMSANPGGPGHAWIKKRYVDFGPYRPHSWQPQPEEAAHVWIESVFVPSRLEDNPALHKADPAYEAKLAAAGTRTLYRAWRHGDWSIVAGQYFDIWDPVRHVIKTSQVNLQPWNPKWISMDWGFADACAIHWHALLESRQVVTYRELVVNKMEAPALADLIAKNTLKDEKIQRFYLGGDAFAQKESVRTIADEIAAVMRERGLPPPVRADNDRIGGWQLLYQMLVSGHWKIAENCIILIESLPLLQRDEKHVEDVAESAVDHAPDSARYGLKTHLGNVQMPTDELVKAAMTAVDPTTGEPDYTRRQMQANWMRANLNKKKIGSVMMSRAKYKTATIRRIP